MIWLKVIGFVLVADALGSIAVYWGHSHVKGHLVRATRLVIGISLIIWG